MTDKPVIIAGGGIGGLATALTLHQIGVPCVVYEAVREMRPLGVGINLQPNAVRELYDLGLGAPEMDRVGVPAKEWALVGLNGHDIYSETRGLDAGYNWPQYAVHRGLFHMLLHDTFVARAGRDAVKLGARVMGYEKTANGVTAPGWVGQINGALSTDQDVDLYYIRVGDPTQVAETLYDYWQLGIDEFILSGYPHVEESRRVAKDVLPILRDIIKTHHH